MSFKTTYLLFATLLGLLVVVGATQRFGPKPGEGSFVATDLRAGTSKDDDIVTVEIARQRPTAERLVFQRRGKTDDWELTAPAATRAEGFLVTDLIKKVRNLQRLEQADLPRSLEVNGLKPPAVVVTLRTAEDTAFSIHIGDETAGATANRLLPVTSSGRPSPPLAVRRSDLENAFKGLNAFRSKDLLGGAGAARPGSFESPQATVQRLRLARAAVPLSELALRKVEGPNDPWRFEVPAHYGDADFTGTGDPATAPPGVPNGVRDLLAALDVLRVEYDPEKKIDDFVADNVKNPEEKYGLGDRPATLLIELERSPDKDGKPRTATLLIGNKVEKSEPLAAFIATSLGLLATPGPERPLLVAPLLHLGNRSQEGSFYYARLKTEPNVVRLSVKSVEPILNAASRPVVYRSRDLLPVADNNPRAIDLKNATGTIKFRKAGAAAWRLEDDAGKTLDADSNHVQKFLGALTLRRQVIDWPDPARSDADLGLDDASAVATLSLWPEKPKDDKPKDDKAEAALGEPSVKLTIGPRKKVLVGTVEQEVVYVKRAIVGGDTTRLEVPAVLADLSREARVAFLDRTLPSFPAEADVTHLTVSHGADVYEVEKEKKGETITWRFVQPADLKDRPADRNAIADVVKALRELGTPRLVSEKPSADDLERFGLREPEVRVVLAIKKDDKTEERSYLFGKPTEAKDFRHARQGERDIVFHVVSEVIDRLRAVPVSRVVFSIAPEKIKALKLSGWKKGDEPAVTLELARKEGAAGTWTAKVGEDAVAVDDVKVETLAVLLAKLNAERFLSFKQGAKPEHKLDEKDGAVRISITVDGTKEALVLTLAGPMGDAPREVAAEASTLPGDVFAVPANPFAGLVADGVKHFAKDAK